MTSTARILNIGLSTGEEAIRRFCENKALPLASRRSRISLVRDTGNEYQVATVTFDNPHTLRKAIDLPYDDRELDGKTLDIESDFLGFTVLSEGNELDIVALHGLNGHAFNTWQHTGDHGDHFMWLRDKAFPGARVMTYGYNADVLSDLSAGRIRTFAETFLEDLLSMRDNDSSRNRRLILVAYSMGGLVVKQALMVANTRADEHFKPILDSVRGVVFLGTPHHGGNNPAVFVSNYLKTINITVVVREFDANSAILFDLTEDFKQLVTQKDIEIATLYESKKTKVGEDHLLVGIVDQKSAVLGLAHERKVSVNADHEFLCKFKTVTDDSLRKITNMIAELRGPAQGGAYDTRDAGALPTWSPADPTRYVPQGRRMQTTADIDYNIPSDFKAGGQRLGGHEVLYVGSAILSNMVIPGTVHASSSAGCHYALNGKEITHSGRYDLLPITDEMEWIPARNGDIPPNPVVGGYEENKETTFHARVRNGATDEIPGKLVPSQGHALFTFDGLEHSKEEYDVLCWRTKVSLPEPQKSLDSGPDQRQQNGIAKLIQNVIHQMFAF